jgi:hypothetical protein
MSAMIERCATCRRKLSWGSSITVTGRGTYCFPCYNAATAEASGIRFDNAELAPVTLRDAMGAPHTFRIQSRLAAGCGHVMEALEDGRDGQGYSFSVMGPAESDALALFTRLYAEMRRGLDHLQLVPGPAGPMIGENHELTGRIEMDPEGGEPVLVVDGQPLSWAEVGRLVLSYEGWAVRISMEDRIREVEVDDEGSRSSDLH